MRETMLYCAKITDGQGVVTYRSFYRNPVLVKFSDSRHPIVRVRVAEATTPTLKTYWAWWDERDQQFHHVYWRKMFVEMCFTYGYEVEEQKGNGWLLPVTVEEVPE